MKRLRTTVLAAGLVAALAAPAHAAARPVTDCPLCDAPFSADAPLIDILLSPAAKAVLERAAPGRFSRPPPNIGTTPPSFAAAIDWAAMSGKDACRAGK